MRIVFISSEFTADKNEPTGGIGTYLLNITEGLVNLGHEMIVITLKKHKKTSDKKIKIVYVDWGKKFINWGRKILPFSLCQRILNFLEYPIFFSIGAFLKINEIEKKEKIDIIEGNDFGGELFFYLLFRKRRPPVVLRLHTPSFIIQRFNTEPRNLFYKILKFIETYCLKTADSLYSPTKSLAKIISQETNRRVNKIIPYPFRSTYFFKNIKRKQNLVLYVGKLQPKKGVVVLVKAIPGVVKKFPETLFLFVGPDTIWNGKSVKKVLQEICQKNNVSENTIFYKSEIKKDELYRLYRKATITVIPSLWENFPNVCLEAMSQGSVLIASNNGGLKEIIDNENNGLLFKTNNSKDLKEKIIRLIKNKYLREKMSKTAQKNVVDRYNSNKIVKETINYYQTVLTRVKNPQR